MSLIPWKKNAPAAMTPSFGNLQNELNRMFNNFFADMGGWEPYAQFPAISVSDGDKVINVTAEIPGVDAKDLEISADGNMLTIRGEKKEEKKEEKENFSRVERSYGSFMRRVELPAAVDSSHAEATLEKGVLTLKLPKLAAEKAKSIKVSAR